MPEELIAALARAKVYDLGQPYYPGMPHHPVHPPFLYGLNKAHGEYLRDGLSSASEAISLGGHVGTHIDALCHFSKDGKVHGGIEVGPAQSYTLGISAHSVDRIEPILRRGVLFDVAGYRGVDVLESDCLIGPEELEQIAKARGIEVRAGDVALIRTGWARYWDDARKYINEVAAPGPGLEAAQWLSSRGVFAAGSDTVAFEYVPSRSMPVHEHLLVEMGIHIIEALDLEALAADGVTEFAFIAAPMKIRGGTGAPIRPLALV